MMPRGLPAYRLLGFPRGKKGVRLRALFDRHVKQAESDGHHDGPKKLKNLPCNVCTDPRGADLRRMLAQTGTIEGIIFSPVSNLPVGCCRIRSVSLQQAAGSAL